MAEGVRNLSVSAPDVNLPCLLVPGAAWKGYYYFPERRPHLPDDDYQAFLERGRLYYRVRLSHSDRCVRGRVKPAGISELFG
jgi:hypothetical protein